MTKQKKYAKCVWCGALWQISVYQNVKNYYCPYCQNKRRKPTAEAERKKRNEK